MNKLLILILGIVLFASFVSASVENLTSCFKAENNYIDEFDNMSVTPINSPTFNSTHQIVGDYAFNFDSAASQYARNESVTGADSIMAVSGWFRPEAQSDFAFTFTDATGDDRFYLQTDPSGWTSVLRVDNTAHVVLSSGATPLPGALAYITINIGSCSATGGAELWVNETRVGTDADTHIINDSIDEFAIGTSITGGSSYSSQWHGVIDEFVVYTSCRSSGQISASFNSGLGIDCIPIPDTTPPVNSSWNVTSVSIFTGENSLTWNFDGTINITYDLLSLTVTTDENSNGSCRLDVEQNYTEMVAADSNYKLSTTETTSHSYTVYDNISTGSHCLYCSFVDADGNGAASGTSSSGCLNLTLWGSVGVTLNQPANNSLLGTAITNFNFTAISGNDLTSAELWTNFSGTWKLNQTLTVVANNTKTNFSIKSLPDGLYLWNVRANTTKIGNFSKDNYTLRVFFLTPPNISWAFHQNISELLYPVNYSLLNLTALINHTTGNFTWNFTEYNASAYNLSDFVFNVTNTGGLPGDVTIKQNQTKDWYEWWCSNNTAFINVTNSSKPFYGNLGGGSSLFVNCTLSVKNISQTHVNRSVIIDRAIWDFNWTFNST